MTDETLTASECPQCGGVDLRPGSLVVATLPPSAVRPGKVRKTIEQKYRCRTCGHEFCLVEECIADEE